MSMGFPGGSDGKESAWNSGDHVQSPGREDPLDKEMATHSSILAWRIPGEPGRLQSMGSQRFRHNVHTTYPNQSTDLMKALSKYTRYVSQN